MRFALILTHNRPDDLAACLKAIAPQVDFLVVVDNASDPPVRYSQLETHLAEARYLKLIRDETQPPNLSALWNRGLDWIEREVATRHAGNRWEVAVLCDDVSAPAGWMDAVVGQMRNDRAMIGCTGAQSPWPIVKTQPDNDIMNRMPGAAFVLAGDSGLRADEAMHWWWCDTDLDWQARQAGGMVILPGPVAINSKPNDWTNRRPELAHQAGLDQAAFRAKWGWAPW